MRPDVRDRLVLPLLIPLGLLAVLGLIAFGFGMLLLFNPMMVSVMIALVVAAGILAAFGLESSARPEEQTRAKRAVISMAVVAPLLVGLLVAVDVIPVDARRMVDVEPFVAVPEDAPVVVADNVEFGVRDPETGDIDFDDVQVTVVAAEGERAVIVFENEDDPGFPHDIDIYETEEGMDALSEEERIFDGEIIDPPARIVYEFEAPPAGTYPFHCSVHPQMIGEVTFEEGEPEA
jgi:plastocyanin